MVDDKIAQAMRDKIDEAKREGDSIGGVVQVMVEHMPVGVGSYVQYDRKLDGRIAQGVVSINAFKGVSFGEGFKAAENLEVRFKMKFITIKIKDIIELQII